MNGCHVAIFVGIITHTGYKIGIHQTYFVARVKTFVFFGRFYHEIFSLNVQFFAKRYFSGSQSFIFHVVRSFQLFDLTFRIIVNDQFYRIQDRHHTGTFQFQIFTDAVLQHSIVHRAVCLGHTTQFHKHLDGFRCKSSSSQSGDGYQTRIIPAVYDTLFYQTFDITFSGYHIGQVQFCKFNLLWQILIFQFSYHPVI